MGIWWYFYFWAMQEPSKPRKNRPTIPMVYNGNEPNNDSGIFSPCPPNINIGLVLQFHTHRLVLLEQYRCWLLKPHISLYSIADQCWYAWKKVFPSPIKCRSGYTEHLTSLSFFKIPQNVTIQFVCMQFWETLIQFDAKAQDRCLLSTRSSECKLHEERAIQISGSEPLRIELELEQGNLLFLSATCEH